ncbi:MAG TPA: GxxExxY protein [Patescibacteria group bacterium]
MKLKDKLIHPELSYAIVGVLYQVHNELGRYCGEKQYGDLIETKLKKNLIQFKREKILDKMFSEEKVGRHRIDFLIEARVVLEIKCKRLLEKPDYYQVKRYLEVLNFQLGLLVNFRERILKPRRILN